jgi:transcriptional regulator with XRE-family HTH domain
MNVVARLERGEIQDPHYSTLSAVAGALGMSIGALLGETKGPKAGAPSPPETQEEERRAYPYYPYAWMADAFERLIEGWDQALEADAEGEPLDYFYAITVAAIEALGTVLRMDLPGERLEERLEERYTPREVDERNRLAEQLFDIATRANERYVSGQEAKVVNVRRNREEIRRLDGEIRRAG